MSTYFEALEAHNDMQNPGASTEISEAQKERMRAFGKAHGV